jgi:predicted homoserine dehydrogenase-like protein
MKGLQDPYRTPETQKSYAAKYKQKPAMVTSFADGTKIYMEMAVVANATGFKVGKRGMYGPRCDHVNEAVDLFPLDQMLEGGLVDYILCSNPAGGVFVLGFNEHPIQNQYLNYYKMGNGPLYVFYTPYHICHLEVPMTVARAVIFQDAVISPIAGPVCEVISVAKKDLQEGDIIDCLGGFCVYGMLENVANSSKENLLPIGLAEGCILKNNIVKDQPIKYSDVQIPAGRLCDQLRAEQSRYFFGE